MIDKGAPNGRSRHTVPASELDFAHFLKAEANVKASGPLHDSKLWLGANKGMFTVKTFAQINPFSSDCQKFHGISRAATRRRGIRS